MDSAIPTHLRCPRTISRRVTEDFVPSYPAWVARHDSALKQLGVGYFGVQWKAMDAETGARQAFEKIIANITAGDAIRHLDRAQYQDAQGFQNLVAIAYWDDAARMLEWHESQDASEWWHHLSSEYADIGLFQELIAPRVERFETLFSASDQLEGAGKMFGGVSDQIAEHSYYGSMRERIPLAQTDPLLPTGALRKTSVSDSHIRIDGHENLAMIRSGQDWTDTSGRERKIYLKDVEPVFRIGMSFLEKDGMEVGCYSNRYMQEVDATGNALTKSFGMSFWHSLGDMENWAESHSTHVEIFGTFMKMVQALNFDIKLRLYHEVCVLKPNEQRYEYFNCHPSTGLIRAI
jgi:aldoxime dehydratase